MGSLTHAQQCTGSRKPRISLLSKLHTVEALLQSSQTIQASGDDNTHTAFIKGPQFSLVCFHTVSAAKTGSIIDRPKFNVASTSAHPPSTFPSPTPRDVIPHPTPSPTSPDDRHKGNTFYSSFLSTRNDSSTNILFKLNQATVRIAIRS